MFVAWVFEEIPSVSAVYLENQPQWTHTNRQKQRDNPNSMAAAERHGAAHKAPAGECSLNEADGISGCNSSLRGPTTTGS